MNYPTRLLKFQKNRYMTEKANRQKELVTALTLFMMPVSFDASNLETKVVLSCKKIYDVKFIENLRNKRLDISILILLLYN